MAPCFAPSAALPRAARSGLASAVSRTTAAPAFLAPPRRRRALTRRVPATLPPPCGDAAEPRPRTTASATAPAASPVTPPATSLLLAAAAAVLSVPTVLLQALTLPLAAATGVRLSRPLCALWLRLALLLCGIRVRVQNADALPRAAARGALLAANASSPLETLSVAVATGAAALLPSRLLGLPFVGWALRLGGHIDAGSGSDRRALGRALDAASAQLAAGDAVCVPAEGRRGADGVVGRFLSPPFKAARNDVDAPVAVCPTCVRGAWDVCKGGLLPAAPGVVEVVVGHPLPDGLSEKEMAVASFETVRAEMPERFRGE